LTELPSTSPAGADRDSLLIVFLGGRQIKTPQWRWTGTKCMQYLQCFQVQRYFFCIFKLNNAVYLLGVLTYTFKMYKCCLIIGMTQAFLKPLSWNESQSIGKSLKKERNWCLNHVNILSGSKVMTKNRHQNMYICIFFGPIYQNGHQIVTTSSPLLALKTGIYRYKICSFWDIWPLIMCTSSMGSYFQPINQWWGY
jgi:hypothetical protein